MVGFSLTKTLLTTQDRGVRLPRLGHSQENVGSNPTPAIRTDVSHHVPPRNTVVCSFHL